MKQSVFEFESYKEYVRAAFARAEKGGRGLRQKLAQFLACQDSYVSLVLSGDRHFSVEQGEGVARFLHLPPEEKEVFLLLLLRDRAGTEESRKYFHQQVEERRQRYLDFRSRVQIESDLSDAEKMTYYSSALYAKVHMFLTLPGEWAAEKLARRFRVPPERITEVCQFLASRGLIEEKAGKYSRASKFLFLGKRSPFVGQHHANWRLDAVQAIQERKEEGVHLSMAVTLSEKDADELRRRIAAFVQECSELIKGSKEETLMAFCLDFYRP